MLAKIIIKRRFRQGATDEILALLHDLRFAAMSQPGYVSGETPGMALVMGRFRFGCGRSSWPCKGPGPPP